MKRTKAIIFYLLILLLTNIFVAAQQIKPSSELEDVKKWFSAWELVSKKIYKINALQPVEFVIFNEQFVYSTSKISIPNGENISGPNLLNKKLAWKKAIHNGKITLPDNQIVPIGY